MIFICPNTEIFSTHFLLGQKDVIFKIRAAPENLGHMIIFIKINHFKSGGYTPGLLNELVD